MENGNSFSTSLPWRSFKAGFGLTGLAEGSRCRRPEWANHIGSMPGHHSGHSRMEKSFRSRRPVPAVKPVSITSAPAPKNKDYSGSPAAPAATTPRPGPTRSGPPRQTVERLAAVPRQLCRLGNAPPLPLQTRPRPSPPLGPPKPSGPRRPAQKSSGGGAPLATPAHGRTLATGGLAPPLVPSLEPRLPQAQPARRLPPPLPRLQTLRTRTAARRLRLPARRLSGPRTAPATPR